MKPAEPPPDLASLRELFGQPIPDSPSNAGIQVRPGLWRKRYGLPRSQRYLLRAPPLDWNKGKELVAPQKIAALIDKRSLIELLEARDNLMKQITTRAASGDKKALSLLLSTARGIVGALETLEKCQPDLLRATAEASPTWPVLLSPNPQDISRAKEVIARLKVGAKALTPRRAGQKVDHRNFWTQLAAAALEAVENNRAIVPVLEEHCKNAFKRRRRGAMIWRTKVEATYYYINSSDCILIADWEKQCVTLSSPITQANFKRWWNVIKLSLLERWYGDKEFYEAALKQIGQPDENESRRRAFALARVEQALRSFAVQ